MRSPIFLVRRVHGSRLLAMVITLAMGSLAIAAELPEAPGLGDPGTLEALVGDSGTEIVLRGRDARRQLVIAGQYSSGRLRDLTRELAYGVEPADIAQVDETGMVIPLADGRALVTATSPEGANVAIEVAVEHFAVDTPVNFPNQIVPIFTKLGCNSGGCHGKASGQNGFRLSLLGFEPTEDFEHLVKEARGRRVFPASPDQSLLLAKPINRLPHGGGQLLEEDSHEYRLMRRWIAQGMPYGNADDPVVTRIEVVPHQRTMNRRGEQQITVLAHYSDGAVDDVTQMAQFDPNDPEMAEVSADGLVTTLDLTGEVAVMARYQGQVDVFRASIPLGIEVAGLPDPNNFIDEIVNRKLTTLGIPPSAPSDDLTFIRRVTIDVAGRLPTPEETREFVTDTNPSKRDELIDRLVDSADYADYFANKWNAVLRNRRPDDDSTRGSYAFHDWIRESLYENKPYDWMVREIVAASGDVGDHPAVAWYREVNSIDQQVEDTAQLFLGLRIQCAHCHHHPFEKWSQRDYYAFSAFFSRVKTKSGDNKAEDRVYHQRGLATAVNPKTNEKLLPTGLDAEPLSLDPDDDPRLALADWMASPDNRFFAPALVNRYWKHFFSRGLVDPEDDMRVTNPASNPELLEALAQHFIETGFDMKDLVRTICRSNTYQLSSEPNEFNLSDKQNFSRYYPKRLTAEVLLDAVDSVTDAETQFSRLPAEMRAVSLPDSAVDSYFLTVFGRPEAASACECERSQDANLAQSLHLLNSSEIHGKLTSETGRAALLATDDGRSHEEKLQDLYLWAYARPPIDDELSVALAHLDRSENKQQAYEDIIWALINTKEFLFNH